MALPKSRYFRERYRRYKTEQDEPKVVQQIRKIVDEKQAGRVAGHTVDLFTASALLKVWGALTKPEAKEKFVRMAETNIVGLASFAFKQMAGKRREPAVQEQVGVRTVLTQAGANDYEIRAIEGMLKETKDSMELYYLLDDLGTAEDVKERILAAMTSYGFVESLKQEDRPIQFGRFGLGEDPIGKFIRGPSMPHGEEIEGIVTGVEHDEIRGYFILYVRAVDPVTGLGELKQVLAGNARVVESLKHERRTPWGQSDAEYPTSVPGIVFYATPGHGGFFVPDHLAAQLPGWARAYADTWAAPSGGGHWFEEDVAALIVLYYWPETARALGDSRDLDEIRNEAAKSIRHWIPEAQL